MVIRQPATRLELEVVSSPVAAPHGRLSTSTALDGQRGAADPAWRDLRRRIRPRQLSEQLCVRPLGDLALQELGSGSVVRHSNFQASPIMQAAGSGGRMVRGLSGSDWHRRWKVGRMVMGSVGLSTAEAISRPLPRFTLLLRRFGTRARAPEPRAPRRGPRARTRRRTRTPSCPRPAL